MLSNEQHIDRISVAEMMFKWMSGKTRKDSIRNKDIRDNLGVAPMKIK